MKPKKLTEKQKAKLPELREKWLKIGTCTEPADRKRAEKGVVKAYQAADLELPKKILWFNSPYAGAVAAALIALAEKDSENSKTKSKK